MIITNNKHFPFVARGAYELTIPLAAPIAIEQQPNPLIRKNRGAMKAIDNAS
jgi:hypothetical protein